MRRRFNRLLIASHHSLRDFLGRAPLRRGSVVSEYVRSGVTTNHIEGFFSQLKRSVDGTFHAVSDVHLPRYLAEFDYRYSTRKVSDAQRFRQLMSQTAGRRLTYGELTGR